MQTLDLQAMVGTAVTQRGYRAGWTAEQFAARQVAKLQEELAELAEQAPLPKALPLQIEIAGDGARRMFDDAAVWAGDFDNWNIAKAKAELADVVVVALALAAVLDELTPPYDVLAEAVAKATADVTRGVRGDCHE